MAMILIHDVELIFWNLPRGQYDSPLIATVKDVLSQKNLNSNRAPSIAPSSAFRRAVDSFQDKRQIREARLTSKCFTRKSDNCLCAQFDLVEEENGCLKRQLESIYSFDSNSEEVELVSGKELNMADAYRVAVTTYNWGDLSEVIQTILAKDGLGSYSPRSAGGIYYVPIRSDNVNLLDRIESFCDSLHIGLLRHPIPDTSVQRGVIAEAISQSFLDKFQEHANSILSYGEETRPGVIDNRCDAIQVTLEMVTRLSHLLMERQTLLVNRGTELLKSCEAAKQLVETSESSRGGRRILIH